MLLYCLCAMLIAVFVFFWSCSTLTLQQTCWTSGVCSGHGSSGNPVCSTGGTTSKTSADWAGSSTKSSQWTTHLPPTSSIQRMLYVPLWAAPAVDLQYQNTLLLYNTGCMLTSRTCDVCEFVFYPRIIFFPVELMRQNPGAGTLHSFVKTSHQLQIQPLARDLSQTDPTSVLSTPTHARIRPVRLEGVILY